MEQIKVNSNKQDLKKIVFKTIYSSSMRHRELE